MPHPSPTPTGFPSPIIIIGLPATIASACHQLEALGGAAPKIAGCIALEGASGQGATGIPATAPILGSLSDLPAICDKHHPRAALVSLPLAMSGAISRVRAELRGCSLAERFLPTIADALTHDGMLARPGRANFDFAALIGRPVRPTNTENARRVIAGRRVLITGAGGSIGSELARRCADLQPSLLVLMDRSENALFEIERQIAASFPEIALQRVLHDVVDEAATMRLFREFRPEVVFHAAAHKHVPMMEDHPAAAVNNNVFGTKSVADAALAVGTRRFVMVSTDKAVNPTSVMGSTKRIAELYVRSLNQIARRDPEARQHFSLVRFGNVLGSACSVLPIWTAQLAEGQPITVTHPDMTRYFMSIPEAAALVIQAATIEKSDSHGDEVFVLDMGEPVRIAELAERFVLSQGLRPRWEDAFGKPIGRLEGQPAPGHPSNLAEIPIRFTGARPGEKLHEELAYQAEELALTSVPGILGWSGDLPDQTDVERIIEDLQRVRNAAEARPVLDAIRTHVPRSTTLSGVCSVPEASAA